MRTQGTSHTPPVQTRKLLHRLRQEALESFHRLPKPVVISCSAAGEDRSAPIAAYLYAMRVPHTNLIR